MKKIVSLIAFLLFSVAAFAQAPLKTTTTGTATTTTVTNAAYTYLYSSGPIAKNYAPTGVTVQVNFTRNSGTAAGTVSLWGSLDNVNWEIATTDSSSLSNTASQTKFMKATGLKYPYFRVRFISTGTQSTTISGLINVN